MRKRLQQCFERGQQLVRQEKADHDYAHSMFAECVLRDPANLEYVEAMFDNLQRKYKNNKRGARLKGFGGRSHLKKAVAAEDWDEVLQLGLEMLKTNPWDVATLRSLAWACQAKHYNEVELRYLKNALDVNPKDVEVNKHCAESLARMGQFDQAIACWHRVEDLDKGNQEAKKRISELTLEKTMGTAHPETRVGSGATPKGQAEVKLKENPRATPPAKAAPQESASTSPPGIGSDDEIAELIALAKRQTADHQFPEAYQTLKKALEQTGGGDLKLKEMVEDAQIRMVRAHLAIAEQRAAAQNTNEANDLVARFRAELNRQELAVYAARAERFPNDLGVKFELGLRLKREANYREAIKCFDACRHDTARRAVSTLEMGECYQHLKQYSNAMKCYQSAITDAEPGSPCQKVALYRAGILATALKHLEAAENHLDRLVKLDPDFRDAAARLDKLRLIRNSD